MRKLSWILVALMAVASTGCSVFRGEARYRDDVRVALESRSAEITSCYEEVLQRNPEGAGRVTVRFEVDTQNGRVTNVRVDHSATTAPDAVAACVAKGIQGAAISPVDARTAEVTWVYEFARRS